MNQALESRWMPLRSARWPADAELVRDLCDAEYLRCSFAHGDTMPPGRKRLLHAFGCVGAVEWVVEKPTGFRGLLGHGGWGIIRLSLAGHREYCPGLALKFPVDQPVGSANVLAMPSLEPQRPGGRFFREVFQTRLEPPTENPEITFYKSFDKAVGTQDALCLPLDQLVNCGQGGAPVGGPAPSALQFRAVDTRMSSPDTRDFRVVLEELEPGPLFDVETEDGDEVGQLVLRSALVSSQWGDEELYFRHAYH
jgi:hypothetical protein